MWAAFDAHHFFEKNIPKILLTMALRSLWPGVVFSPLSPSRLAELPDPALPGPHWVRVRNRLCGVCASDLHLLFARTAPQVSPAALPGTERIYLGHEVLGEVVEVGAGVTTWQEGDRVIMDAHGINCVNQAIDPPCRHCRKGNYSLCENTSVGQGPHGVGGGWSDGFTAHEIGVYRVPDDLDDETAMLIEPLSVGMRTVMRRLPQPGECVLIVGCGTIGLAAIGAARALSPECHITAMARYPQQVEMARKLGADEVVTGEDPYEATARITGGKLYTGMFNARMVLGGFDVVYDCVGSEKTVQDSLRWARAGVWDADNNNVPVVKLFLFRPANRDVRETIVAGARKLGRFIFDREVDIRWCASMVPLTERTAGSMMSPLKDCPFQDEPGRFAAQSELV